MDFITVPAHDNDPDPVIEFVEARLERYDCSPKAIYQIQVAIEEILVNIVSYARLTEDDHIEVRCEVLDGPLRVVLQFLDAGVPFDPLEKGDPDTSLEAIMEREGGLGIFLVKQMMDEVSYSYEGGRNTLTIQKGLEG